MLPQGWLLWFLSWLLTQTLVSGYGYPEIVTPKVREGDEPVTTILPIKTNRRPEYFRQPCEVRGRRTKVEWGKVTKEKPYEMQKLPTSFTEVEEDISQRQRPGAEYIWTLQPAPGQTFDPLVVDGFYRCRVTYQNVKVYSPVVHIVLLGFVASAVPNGYLPAFTTDITTDEWGDATIPCIHPERKPAYNPKYLPTISQLITTWDLGNVVNGRSDYRAISPDPQTGDPDLITAGGYLHFSPLQEKHLELLSPASFLDETEVLYSCEVDGHPIDQYTFDGPRTNYRVSIYSIRRDRRPPEVRLLAHSTPAEIHNVAGQLTVVYCLFSSGPNGFPRVQWEFINDAGVEPEDYTSGYGSGASLGATISFIAELNLAGQIRCSAPGTTDTQTFTFTVGDPLSLTEEAEMDPRQTMEGGEVTYRCAISSSLQIAWYHNGVQISDTDLIYSVSGTDGQELTLRELRPAQSGSIQCSASNSDAIFTATSRVIVLAPYQIVVQNVARSPNATIKTTKIALAGLRLPEELTAETPKKEVSLRASYAAHEFARFTKRTWVWISSQGEVEISSESNPYVTVTHSTPEADLENGNGSSVLTFSLQTQAQANEVEGQYYYLLEGDGASFTSNRFEVAGYSRLAVEELQYTVYILGGSAILAIIAIGLCVWFNMSQSKAAEEDNPYEEEFFDGYGHIPDNEFNPYGDGQAHGEGSAGGALFGNGSMIRGVDAPAGSMQREGSQPLPPTPMYGPA